MVGGQRLSFGRLHEVNVLRCSKWHPGFPEDHEGWKATDWSNAAGGEVGETCNVVKKLRRVDIAQPGSRDPAREVLLVALGNEIADTIIYLDLLRAFLRLDPPEGFMDDLEVGRDKLVPDYTGADWSNDCMKSMGRLCGLVASHEEGLPGGQMSLLIITALWAVLIKVGRLATFYEVDLTAAVISKFNEVSTREGFEERL